MSRQIANFCSLKVLHTFKHFMKLSLKQSLEARIASCFIKIVSGSKPTIISKAFVGVMHISPVICKQARRCTCSSFLPDNFKRHFPTFQKMKPMMILKFVNVTIFLIVNIQS